ncbi:threonine synthase [Hyphomicrobium methylovorum]|uniref:threonine synthase n=1 Tax=Hyphomicrobium methylovorum TaxID=84 RepID=UPI0015E6E868|nr:threonine synthase [Hyphomicrobium methylovorum]MBA2125831.1 threonine synthase [Hyphomicrobium methylovorum]
MKYISTRGTAPTLGFEDVLLAGLARDGGLYLPDVWPTLKAETIASFPNKSFVEIAVDVIHPFTGDEISRAELHRMATEAYATFDTPEVTPLVELKPGLSILELFHGPTLAFKDVAMQLLARLMDHVLEKRNARATIVGATSGDTGGAAIEAFRSSKRVDVVILFPEGRVSDVQRRMMTTPKEANVHAVAIHGTFDDCQALVKAMFNDHDFRDSVELSGVNSINWARIVAQVTYYFWAASRLGNTKGLSFAVPTGNFGDIFAGYAAKRLGLEIDKLIIASNANDILPRALETGVYAMKDVVATMSPSMDIQISSNFERYLFEASGRDSAFVRDAMTSLASRREFDLGPAWSKLKSDFAAVSATEGDVADAIRNAKATYGYGLDPHTACAYVAAERETAGSNTVVLSTAHPAKFPDAIESITGERPGLPAHLEHLLQDTERFETLPNDLAVLQDFVRSRCRASTGVQ